MFQILSKLILLGLLHNSTIYTSPVKCIDIPLDILQEILCDPPSVFSFPQEVVTLPSGGGCLLEFPTVYIIIRLSLGKFWCFGWLVPYERWLLTRGGRTRSFDCIIIQIEFILKTNVLIT